MNLSSRISAALQAVGTDVKSLFARAMPPGGAVGNVLTKTAAGDYAAGWSAPAAPASFGELTDPARKLFIYTQHSNGLYASISQHSPGIQYGGATYAITYGTYGAANTLDRQHGYLMSSGTALGNSAYLFMSGSQQMLNVDGPDVAARIIGGFPLSGNAADQSVGFIGQGLYFSYSGGVLGAQQDLCFGFACDNTSTDLSLVYTTAVSTNVTVVPLGPAFPQAGALYQVDFLFKPRRAQAGYYDVSYTIQNIGSGASATGTVLAVCLSNAFMQLGLRRYSRDGFAGKLKHMLSLASWDMVR